ncbi:uncharacterized protein LOC119218450 [Pungitius pungitius]|uniref:uncharacterized protein LOC119218450 n=1 Tax=Pungitius pungitius TaxID=134920 RepID=UPI002E0F78BE
MQRYRWPGHEMQLLGELQRQQNNAQFCDVLLKTDGITVPTHSCVLAALSPYLSQRLLASPSPPLGQKRELLLQAVKPQTLLKLVGLLYCGEVEVKGSAEQNDLLSAAGQFGITDLVNGPRNAEGWEGELQKHGFGSFGDKNESREIQGAQVQAGLPGWRNTGKPNVKADQKTGGCSKKHSVQNEQPHPVPEPSVALKPHCITWDKHLISSTPSPHIPCVHSGAQIVPNPVPLLSSSGGTFPVLPNEDLNSTTPPEDSADKQSSKIGNIIQVLDKEGPGLRDGKTITAPPSHRDEMPGEERGSSAEKRHAHVGMKSLSKIRQMQQMMDTDSTQISIKVKLRRRSNGEVWEVVSVQDTEDALSVLHSLKQDDSSHKRLQANPMSSEPPLSSVQPDPTHKPESLTIQPATSHLTEQRPHPDSDSQLLSSDFFNEELESIPLTQPPGSAEECDEQMEKLLEDIMMGLNILPNFDRDCKKSQCLQTNHEDVLADCPVPVTENEQQKSGTHAGTEGRAYYQHFETPIGNVATNTGISCNFTAQNQPGSSSLSSAQLTSPWDHSSLTPGTSPQGKTLNCQHTDALSGQRQFTSLTYFPASQEPPSQDNRYTVELFPQMNENGAESLHSLPCVDDLRLPRCLSPLEPSTSTAKHQPDRNSSTNPSDNVELRSSVQGLRWLAVKPGLLRFPLSAITHRASKGASLPGDSNHSNSSQRRQKQAELNPRGGDPGTASCSVRAAEGREATSGGHQNVAKEKSDLRNMKKSLKCKQMDTKGEVVVPKRRKMMRSGHPLETNSPSAYNHVKVSDGAKGQIHLGVCLVSLSSNNVLAKEREMAANSNVPDPFVGKTNKPSTITESLRGTTRGPAGPTTSPMRIKTRGFLKKTQTPSSSSTESPVLKPASCRAQIVNKQDVPKQGCGSPPKRRGRGRPRKTKIIEIPPDEMSHDVKREEQIDGSLSKEESEKTRCKKQIGNERESEAVPPTAFGAEAGRNFDVIPARRLHRATRPSRMVSLKEFQELIKLQHSKTRKSKNSQDEESRETAGVAECEEEKTRGSRSEDLTQETEMHIAKPQDRDGLKECPHVCDVRVDDNNNDHIFNKSAAEDDESKRDETNVSGSNESRPALGEEVESAAETEQPLKCPHEARGEGGSGEKPRTAIHDEGSFHSDTHLPQEDKIPSLSHRTVQRTGETQSDAVGSGGSSGCDEEEEVEVDVVLLSPDKVSPTQECENVLDHMEITPEEEDEEDGNEIDVTGDEAE